MTDSIVRLSPDQLHEILVHLPDGSLASQLREGLLTPTWGEMVNVYGEKQRIEEPHLTPYITAAREHCTDDLEIDDAPIVSEGGDPGAWVSAWVWVTDAEAGVERDEEDEE